MHWLAVWCLFNSSALAKDASVRHRGLPNVTGSSCWLSVSLQMMAHLNEDIIGEESDRIKLVLDFIKGNNDITEAQICSILHNMIPHGLAGQQDAPEHLMTMLTSVLVDPQLIQGSIAQCFQCTGSQGFNWCTDSSTTLVQPGPCHSTLHILWQHPCRSYSILPQCLFWNNIITCTVNAFFRSSCHGDILHPFWVSCCIICHWIEIGRAYATFLHLVGMVAKSVTQDQDNTQALQSTHTHITHFVYVTMTTQNHLL